MGGLPITQSVLTTWFIMISLFIMAWSTTYKCSLLQPSTYQLIWEGVLSTMYDAIKEVLPDHVELIFPFVATLWIFILVSNLIGVIPGFYSPTADLSVTASLAIMTFLSVHWFGIRAEGWREYLKHYIKPTPFLLPFHLISEISRTLALAVRLFGNIMSLQLTALIVLMIAGFLVPIPILILHIIEAIIQAYIFGMLALIYIAGGIQAHELKSQGESL
ncbi:TPA: F0F1 ATP synthase subunit A [Legionella pneumophila]|uniref:F0F1 ATP synthase subunit A n=1 Tax=Legionella pneumophila TaxID=446 RepID=UPI001CD18C45|nr:F0F1 ATP synthase subunit A [Legionella pneumophila]MCW8432240.1 F0F1 ATP synthase subunit A [Legionella pneumophila]MCW8438483.1 F0F1 ATP synthase subunit A [Legionella pneumophila]MCW8441614.1 F0F1 ATP synthase subunit A [Legionella pneumophila]MCW8465043.1 F0F1 ATP synthase subunit A [Legionella pneumophila]MCW8473441.1 F0F1 ATP synthase subunit A [Legionella pneumophila]